MKYIVTINGKNYEVEVERGKATIISTSQAPAVQAQPVTTPAPAAPASAPQNAPAAPAPQNTPSPGNVSGEAIKAPMPGTILRIRVSKGTAVKKGDILLVLEAMKMENEIMAPRDGVVSGVFVSEGATVSTGDTLIALD
ncbi:MAG: biotin/lipoyl-binding protein [Clostridiaceae bacterium]|nr:biotin/lipoyl-binding protein [Clostridiaceae bacterium]